MKGRSVRWVGRTALITGASSGIGEATARRLAREGLCVLLVARRTARLEALAAEIRAGGGEARVLACDLADERARQRLVESVLAHGCPDVLVNSAGWAWYGYAGTMGAEQALDMVRVNVEGTVHLTLALLPEMLKRGSGHVIQISSIVGSLPEQGVALYSATKSFVDSFSSSLWRETRGTGVQVSAVRPGPVKTELYSRATTRQGGRPIPAESQGVPVERVVAAVWSVLQHPRRRVHVPWIFGLVEWFEPLFGWIIDLVGPVHLRLTDPPKSPTAGDTTL